MNQHTDSPSVEVTRKLPKGVLARKRGFTGPTGNVVPKTPQRSFGEPATRSHEVCSRFVCIGGVAGLRACSERVVLKRLQLRTSAHMFYCVNSAYVPCFHAHLKRILHSCSHAMRTNTDLRYSCHARAKEIHSGMEKGPKKKNKNTHSHTHTHTQVCCQYKLGLDEEQWQEFCRESRWREAGLQAAAADFAPRLRVDRVETGSAVKSRF